jgi:hypothetical protein
MEFIKRIKDRTPEYVESNRELINKFTISQGGTAGTATEKDKWEQGKYFSTVYEFYLYAMMLGLKRDYRIPISTGTKTSKFIEIRYWQPQDIVDYAIMSVIAKSDIDLNALEDLEESEVEKEILKLRKLMEEYANGGFDIINSKLSADSAFFENNENCFLDLLETN